MVQYEVQCRSDGIRSAGFRAVQDTMQAVQHNPSFSLMVAFPHSVGLEFGACQLVGHEALMFISRDSSKPVCTLSIVPFALHFSS